MPTAFAKAFQNKAKAAFDKAKTHKHKTGGFMLPKVDDGSYTALITVETNVITKGKMEGVPVVKFTATIGEGKFEGKEPTKSFFCEGKTPPPEGSDEMPTAEQQLLGLIGFLLPDYDVSGLEVDQVEQALEIINKRGLICEIGVKNTENTATKKKYQNVYFNRLLSEVPAEDSESDSDPDEDPADDPDDFQEFDAPAKGDTVLVDGKDGEWTVDSVSQSKELANLHNDDGDKLRNIGWADITIV